MIGRAGHQDLTDALPLGVWLACIEYLQRPPKAEVWTLVAAQDKRGCAQTYSLVRLTCKPIALNKIYINTYIVVADIDVAARRVGRLGGG
jgi:hypothetical protein